MTECSCSRENKTSVVSDGTLQVGPVDLHDVNIRTARNTFIFGIPNVQLHALLLQQPQHAPTTDRQQQQVSNPSLITLFNTLSTTSPVPPICYLSPTGQHVPGSALLTAGILKHPPPTTSPTCRHLNLCAK
jgi:hypothetical protein